MELRNITRYYPEVMPYGSGVQYFISEDGKDFYEYLDTFTLRYKLLIDSDGVICSMAEDVSTLYPVGYSVVETDILPEGFDIFGGWMFIDGKVVAVPVDYAEKAETQRQRLLEDANELIAGWVTDLQLGIISDDEKENLIQWRQYIKLLQGLDFSLLENEQDFNAIEWPELPVNK